MKIDTVKVSEGGQISIPAAVRRRWGTRLLAIEDRGDTLVLRPLPADPLRAARGSLKGGRFTSDEMRAIGREEEAEIEQRREW